jgi:hypothetical protein
MEATLERLPPGHLEMFRAQMASNKVSRRARAVERRER